MSRTRRRRSRQERLPTKTDTTRLDQAQDTASEGPVVATVSDRWEHGRRTIPPAVGFAGPSARASDPDTSVLAADADEPTRRFRTGMAVEVLHDIGAAGERGCTVDEVCELHPTWDRGVLARRVTDLRQAGLVVDSGRRRPTRRQCPAIVWRATGVER